MSSKAQWSAFAARHAGQFRMLAVDLLGYGASPFPETEGEPFSLAHEVDAVMATLAFQLDSGEAFHLVGHSYGGATALRLARMLPQRVLSLALFEPVAFHLLAPNDPGRAEIEEVVACIDAARDDHAATRAFIDYWNRAGAFDALPPGHQQRFASQIAKVKLDFQALLGEPASLQDLDMLRMPALVMHGKHAPASTRRVVTALADALPDARLQVTDGGHMAPITHADAVNAVLGNFLLETEHSEVE
jgi:pimeloyl-ACP methyl ester carboxylesterase